MSRWSSTAPLHPVAAGGVGGNEAGGVARAGEDADEGVAWDDSLVSAHPPANIPARAETSSAVRTAVKRSGRRKHRRRRYKDVLEGMAFPLCPSTTNQLGCTPPTLLSGPAVGWDLDEARSPASPLTPLRTTATGAMAPTPGGSSRTRGGDVTSVGTLAADGSAHRNSCTRAGAGRVRHRTRAGP
jgi:hypothetical protein